MLTFHEETRQIASAHMNRLGYLYCAECAADRDDIEIVGLANGDNCDSCARNIDSVTAPIVVEYDVEHVQCKIF